jgi:hypothetical protein
MVQCNEWIPEQIVGNVDHSHSQVDDVKVKTTRKFVGTDMIERAIHGFYLRSVISDCLLIGFIRVTETLKEN